jgi:FdhD protein
MLAPQRTVHFERFASKVWEQHDSETIVETPISLTVNGESWLTFMCTPTQLEALAVGFLFAEGVIQTADEVADVRVCEHGDNIDVWLDHSIEQPKSWRRTSGCTGGMTAVDLLARPDTTFQADAPRLDPEAIGFLVDMLFDSQELYRETGGVHTSALSDGARIILSAEDIGRHNTLDKIAGLCVMKSIWPESRILITTGRISSEMLQKAARLQAPILISRTSPSSLSIEMANRYGITLIGYARRQRFNVYSNAQRVRSS